MTVPSHSVVLAPINDAKSMISEKIIQIYQLLEHIQYPLQLIFPGTY